MIPMQAAARMAAFAFTDAQALTVPDLYPLWSSLPDDTTLTAQEEAVKGTEITRVRDDDGRLHKVTTTHKKQADWAPGIETASLFTVIADPDMGTKDKPIVWVSGMESEAGKYYTDEGVLYIGLEDSGVGLVGQPKDLARYFEAVEE